MFSWAAKYALIGDWVKSDAMKLFPSLPPRLRLFFCLLLAVLALSELIYWAMHRDGIAFAIEGYRILHLLQMASLLIFACWCWYRIRQSAAIPVAERALWLNASTAIGIALLLSFGGDLINSFLFDLSALMQPQTLLSVPFFLVAHLLYISAFWRFTHSTERGRSMGWRLVRNPMLLAWPLLAGLLWNWVVSPEAGTLMRGLSGVYALVVVLMAITSLWVWFCRGMAFSTIAIGGMLFLASDALLGSYLLQGPDRPFWASQLIWISYFLAQMCFVSILLRSGMLLPSPAVSSTGHGEQGHADD